MAEMNMAQALNSAMSVMLGRDPDVLIMGEDVGYFGGVFRCTDGLQRKYGARRVLDTPLTEGGIVGAALGMGVYGLRPVVEIQFADYAYPAFDQLASEAARLRYRSAGEFWAPLTVRTPYGGGIFGGHEGSPAGVQIITPDGSVDYLVTVTGAPNDLCIGPDGRLWLTDPRAPSDVSDPATALPGRLYSCQPDGTDLILHHEGLSFINGLAFTADQDSLLLVETSRQRVLSYPWRDGTEPQPLITLEAGYPDGIALDTDGNVWVGSTYDDSVRVYDQAGRFTARHETGKDSVPTNCCFGGPGLSLLYVSASGAGALVSLPTGSQGLPLLVSTAAAGG